MIGEYDSVVIGANLRFAQVMSQLQISSIALLFTEVKLSTAQSADTQTDTQYGGRQNQGPAHHTPNNGSYQYNVVVITCQRRSCDNNL